MTWWHYLLLVNLYLILFYAFYTSVLRRETFFQLNRIYLVSAALLSFLIPLIQADWVKNLFITAQVRYSLHGGMVNIYAFKPVENNRLGQLTIGQLLLFLYLAGILFLTIRFLLQLIQVNKMIGKPEPSAAYSFFKKISLGKNFVQNDVIIAHEQVHARQWHSLDVLIIEAVMIINWFNPAIYLYRFAIKHIHEFIADQQALKIGADKAEYALLLLSQTFNAPSHQLVNPFYNHSLLKQRIMMIQKSKSQRIVLFKYILSAPLFGLMLILSAATINNSKAVNIIHIKADHLFREQAAAITGITDHGKIPDDLSAVMGTPVKMKNDSVGRRNTSADEDSTSGEGYVSVEVEPSFPGGIQSFYQFIAKTIKYPSKARNNKVQGTVYVRFVIEKDGSIGDVEAVRGPEYGLREETVRVIQLSPRWNPGVQNGKVVSVQYTVPVNYTLGDDEPMTDNKSWHQDNKVYEAVEKEPAFPGGINAFYAFLSRTIRYPAAMREQNVQGLVYVQFVVEKDGSLSNIRAIRSPGASLSEESIRAITLSPKWSPGFHNGEPVRAQYTVPVNFTLNKPKNPVTGSVTAPVDNKEAENFPKGTKGRVYGIRSDSLGYGPGKPLIFVDNKEFSGDLNRIKKGDIQSIAVFKDHSAVDLYGEKAANGAILITTKTNINLKKAIRN